jgi:transposase
MEHYAGIDVSLESASLCVVDATGRIVREAKVVSEPEILIGWFRGLEIEMTRIGLEAGPLSQWLYAGLREAGLAVELLETRHVRDAFKAMPVKTDRNDARGIAQLMRLGWFRPVHCKSLPAQETRALLTARKLLQTKNHDVEMSLRGVLRGFGLKVGRTTPRTFPGRIRELVADHPTLSMVAEALLAARSTLFEQCQKLEKRLRSLAREDGRVRRLMTAPGVGAIVALTYVSAIDEPGRFRSSKARNRLFGAVRGRPLPEWASDFDATSWAQFFLKYLLGNEAVTAVIPGTSNSEHMADNLGAGRGRVPDAALQRKMVAFFEALH